MASAEARIDVILRGLSKLDELSSKLASIENTADSIQNMFNEGIFGRSTDFNTYTNSLKKIEDAANNIRLQAAAQEDLNAKARQALIIESSIRRERLRTQRLARAFTIETKGLDQTRGQLKLLKDQFDDVSAALKGAFDIQDIGAIKTLRNELSALVEDQREWNRTLAGTKNTGINSDFLKEQARGYALEIEKLRGRAVVLSQNEEIIRRLAAAEFNLVKQRNKETGTFTQFADPRLGREILENVKKQIAAEEELQKNRRKFESEYESVTKVNLSEQLSSETKKIKEFYDTLVSGGNQNIAIIKDLVAELERVADKQNELNKATALQSKTAFASQAFERRIAELRSAGAPASAFAEVGAQMRGLKSAMRGGFQFEASETSRAIKEALDAVARDLEAAVAKGRLGARAKTIEKSWEDFFNDSRIEAIRLKEYQKNASASFKAFFDDAKIQAFRINESAKETRQSWENFFKDARIEREKIRDERLSRFARLRGETAYDVQAGPLPAGTPGGARFFKEVETISKELLDVENEIAKIRSDSISESIRLERERLSVVERRKQKEREIRDVLVDALSFGRGANVNRAATQLQVGARNAAIRGGVGLGALGLGSLYSTVQEAVGNVDLGLIQGPAIKAASEIGSALNNALGGVPAIVGDMLSALGNVPSALGLASVAALAFAPAMKTASDAVFLAGKKFGESKFGEDIKLTLDSQTNLFESVINKASEMNMVLDASRSGLDAIGRKIESLPLLPAAGQTAFAGEIRRGRGGAFIGGGAREIQNPDFLATVTGAMAQRTQDAAEMSLRFAQGLGEAAGEADLIRKYLEEASKIRVPGESSRERVIRRAIERGKAIREDRESAEIARERSAFLTGSPYSLSQIPARGELFPGGRTETRQEQYRALLNAQALFAAKAKEVRETTGSIVDLERRLLGGLTSEKIAAKKTSLSVSEKEKITQEQINEELENSIKIIRERNKLLRQRPVAAMTPGERVSQGILDPDSLRAQRRRRVEIGRLDPLERFYAGFQPRRKASRYARATSEGLIGGAFPLLFGQGLGAAVGGGAGGFFGGLIGGNLGFGLSLLGTALGDVFDQLQVKAAAIGNALQNATSNMEALRESGINVTAELEAQVRLLNRYGASEAAQSAVEEAVFRQTGDIGGQGTRLAAGTANELQKAFEGMSAAAATAVGIIGAPFMQAITAAFRGVQAIFFAFNSIITAVTSIVNLIPGMEALGDALYEASLRGTAEYEKRQNELEKETENLGRLLQEQQKYNSELQAASDLRGNELKVAKMLTDYRQKERQSIEAILQKQEELGAGRTAEERKRIETQLSTFRSLEYEKLKQSALQNEKEILDAQEDNVRKIQELNESSAKSYRDMRLQIERQIEDERISAARRIEDAELKGARAVLDFKEKGLQIIQNQRREQIELASAIRGLESQFSADPSREGLAAQLSAAVDQYKNGLAEADENRKLAEEKIQLDAREAALAIERFKQDNARRVARINEDSVKKIAEINSRIDKQRNESYKYAYDLTIQRLIAQEQAAANQLERQKAANDAFLDSPLGRKASDNYKLAVEGENKSIDAQLKAVQIGIQRLRRLESQLPATPQLQNVGSLPVMTSQANEVSVAETQLNSLIQAGRERLLQLEQQNTKESAAAGLARQNLQIINSRASAQAQITESLNERIEDAQRYKQLLASGINPELARQMAAIEGASVKISDVIEMTIKQLEALDDPNLKKVIEALQGIQKDQPTIVSEQIDKTKKALGLEKPTLVEGISAEIDQLKKDLDPITVATNSIINGANAIGSAFGQSFQDIASGAKSTEQALADTFESIGKAFLGMAAEIIAKQLAMITLQAVLKALGGPSIGLPSVNQQGAIDIGRAASFDGGGYTGYGSRTGGIDGKGGFPAILHPRETVIDHTIPALFTPSTIPSVRTEGSPMRLQGGGYPVGDNEPGSPVGGPQGGYPRRSSMSEAMDRYRGNDAPAANRTLNVNYSVTEVNSMRLVTEDQFRAGMDQATKNGASLGERRTINTLKNSRSQRSRLGL